MILATENYRSGNGQSYQAIREELEGIIILYATLDNRIYWSNKWENIRQLVKAGYLRAIDYGPATFGDVGFFRTPKKEGT